MSEFSQVYHEACNSGNALNKIIEVSGEQVSIKLAAEDARRKVVELVELISSVAAFEQCHELTESVL